MSHKLPRSFYNRPTLDVAQELLGKSIFFKLKHGMLSARIVEVEAYIGQDDPACHAARGETERNRVMFGRPGIAYVYFVYGMYYCFNIVTEAEGFPAAVLLRAAEPGQGIESMRRRSPNGGTDKILSGPGKFCRSFGLTTEHSGIDLTGNRLYLCDQTSDVGEIVTTGRVGIRKGVELPYRFFLADSQVVSGGKVNRGVTV